jgi:hypothetical protein
MRVRDPSARAGVGVGFRSSTGALATTQQAVVPCSWRDARPMSSTVPRPAVVSAGAPEPALRRGSLCPIWEALVALNGADIVTPTHHEQQSGDVPGRDRLDDGAAGCELPAARTGMRVSESISVISRGLSPSWETNRLPVDLLARQQRSRQSTSRTS